MTRLWKYALIGLVSMLALAAVLLIVAFILFRSYLSSDDFRNLASYHTSRQLKVHGEFAPFKWTGFSAYTDSFIATGDPDSYIGKMEIDQIRAQLDVGAIFKGQWLLRLIEIKHLKLDLKEPSGPPAEKGSAPAISPWLFFLPQEVVLKQIEVGDADVSWGGKAFLAGDIKANHLVIGREDSSWNISGNGGTLDQSPLPSLNLGDYRLRYAPSMLHLLSCELQDKGTGTIQVTGNLSFEKDRKFDISANLKNVDPAPYLTGDWRARLKGTLTGRVMASGSEQDANSIQSSGEIGLLNGEVEGLPGLDKYEAYIPTSDYRDFPLHTAKFTFEGVGSHFQIKDLVLESQELFRIQGTLNIDASKLDGLCDFGTTKKSLSLLPGAEQYVFPDTHDGYLWTKVRISGTVTNPKEDLSGRLMQAALQSTADKVSGQVKEKAGTLMDAAQELLNGVLK